MSDTRATSGSDFLTQVIAERRDAVRRAREQVPEGALVERIAREASRPRDRLADRVRARRAAAHVAVIAEVKRRSPALGTLAPAALSAGEQARRYADAGADAISVLTEPLHWDGSLDDLREVRAAVGVPVLCKDVVVDAYQLLEARACGADAILLIAEALDGDELRRLVARATALGMTALVEAHDPAAFARAVASGATVVGVNARDLRHPRRLDRSRAETLHAQVRPAQLLVAESGIGSAEDVRALPARVDAVLVGTALMRADDPATLIRAIARLRREPAVEAAR